MPYNAKTNWELNEKVLNTDINRWEQGILDSLKNDGSVPLIAEQKGVNATNPTGLTTLQQVQNLIADNKSILAVAYAINSGNMDSSGNADLLAYSSSTLNFKVDNGSAYKPLALTYADKSQETLTSLASITGLTANGNYSVIKEKGQNPKAVRTPALGKDLLVDFSQGNANDNYELHTPTITGSPTFTNNKFNSNGATGISYPISSLGTGSWCIMCKFKSTSTTARQSIFGASTNGIEPLALAKNTSNKFELYLSTTPSSYDIASAVAGVKSDWSTTTEYWVRLRFTGTQYLVEWSTDYNPLTGAGTWTIDITVSTTTIISSNFGLLNFGFYAANLSSEPLVGTMSYIQVTVGSPVCTVCNQLTQGKSMPLYPTDGDYHCLTATGLQTFKRVSGAWVETQFAQIGTTTVSGAVITAVTTNQYNQNGYDVNKYTPQIFAPDYSKGVAKAFNTQHTATIDGFVFASINTGGATIPSFSINGVQLLRNSQVAGDSGDNGALFRVSVGDTYICIGVDCTLLFFPMKGV